MVPVAVIKGDMLMTDDRMMAGHAVMVQAGDGGPAALMYAAADMVRNMAAVVLAGGAGGVAGEGGGEQGKSRNE